MGLLCQYDPGVPVVNISSDWDIFGVQLMLSKYTFNDRVRSEQRKKESARFWSDYHFLMSLVLAVIQTLPTRSNIRTQSSFSEKIDSLLTSLRPLERLSSFAALAQLSCGVLPPATHLSAFLSAEEGFLDCKRNRVVAAFGIIP